MQSTATRVLFFKTWHCKDTPISRSHCNDEKTKVTCIFIRLQKSVKLSQVKVGLLHHFLMHQWLDVFTTDLNIFEYVHASVNILTCHSASVRFCGRSLFWFNFPLYLEPQKWCFSFSIYAKNIKGYVKQPMCKCVTWI